MNKWYNNTEKIDKLRRQGETIRGISEILNIPQTAVGGYIQYNYNLRHPPGKWSQRKAKCEKIKELLNGEYTIREIAKEVPCDINYVYYTKSRLLKLGEIDEEKFYNYRKGRVGIKEEKEKTQPDMHNHFYSTEEDELILLLKEKYEMQHKDIAEYIGRTETAVRKRYNQILKDGVSKYNEEYFKKLYKLTP